MNETGPDDSRVIQALDDYLLALEEGRALDRSVFLAEHAEVAEPLAKCLDGLDFVHKLAPELSRSNEASVPDPAAAAAIQPEGPLGDFRISREIGRGGMGVVYEARQISLGRRVALKVLPFAAALDARQLQRFKNEAQAAAHLHHTNIVPVYAVGCERGVHYCAMQYIEGQTLAQVIAGLRLRIADLPEEVGAGKKGSAIPQFGSELPSGAGGIRRSSRRRRCSSWWWRLSELATGCGGSSNGPPRNGSWALSCNRPLVARNKPSGRRLDPPPSARPDCWPAA
jgi:hypothetical protein